MGILPLWGIRPLSGARFSAVTRKCYAGRRGSTPTRPDRRQVPMRLVALVHQAARGRRARPVRVPEVRSAVPGPGGRDGRSAVPRTVSDGACRMRR